MRTSWVGLRCPNFWAFTGVRVTSGQHNECRQPRMRSRDLLTFEDKVILHGATKLRLFNNLSLAGG